MSCSVSCPVPEVKENGSKTGERRVASTISSVTSWRSTVPLLATATLPLGSSISSTTGITGALKTVLRWACGGWPTMVYGQTVRGRFRLSTPFAMN